MPAYNILYPPIIIEAGPHAGVYMGGPNYWQRLNEILRGVRGITDIDGDYDEENLETEEEEGGCDGIYNVSAATRKGVA